MSQRITADPAPRWITVASLILLATLLWVAWPGIFGHIGDREYWGTWAGYIKENGLRKTYGSGTDYPPLYQYVLWAYAKLCPDGAEISRNLARLRLVTLLFDVAGLWIVARWIGRPRWWPALALFSLLNVGASYNTIIWGQVDGILSTLLLAALYTAWKQRPVPSAIFFALALTMKLQAVTLLPVWGLLMLNAAAAGQQWRQLGWAVPAFAATLLLVSLPFVLTPQSRQGLYNAFAGSVDRYPYASIVGGNIWYWIDDTNPRWTPDSTLLFGVVSYKTFGLALFLLFSTAALWPLIRQAFGNIPARKKASPITPETVWITGALTVLLFFFLNTQMHERYSHPALLLITAYAFYVRDFFPYCFFCIAYFLNLEKSNEWMLKHYEWIIFDGRLIAGMYAMLIAYLFARLYGWRGVGRGTAETVESRSAGQS